MRRRAANPDGSMTFLEHLEEFRTRLIRVLIALAVGIGISFPFRNKLFNLLLLPQKIRVQNIIADATAWLSSRFFPSEFWQFFELWLRATATDETPFTPNFRSPMDPYTTLFKMCIVIGLILASPILLYQTWAFIVPALKRTERGIAVRLGALMGVFFLLGVTFAFFIVAPLLLELSANLWHSSEIALQPENLWTFNDYMNFIIQLVLAFGIAFELPLVMAFLVRLGIVRTQMYRQNRRYAFFFLIVASAILTPGDVVPMLMMAVPLILLYEFGIVLSGLSKRRIPAIVEDTVDDTDLESA